MKKRIVNKRIKRDTTASIWRKHLREWMDIIRAIDQKESMFELLKSMKMMSEEYLMTDLDYIRRNIAIDMWHFDYTQMEKYCYNRWNMRAKDFAKLKY